MGAGESAEAQARRHAGRARRAGWAAEAWSRGAEGERLTAAELDRLVPLGWSVLHDLPAPGGGNIDHIAVGPPGVAVLDAKNWSGTVTITPDRRLVRAKYDHTAELDRLRDLASHVRGLLERDGLSISVRGYLVLVGDDDRDRAFEDIGDLRVGGLDRLVRRLDQKSNLAPDLVDAVADSIGGALSSRTGPGQPDDPLAGIAPSELFEKVHRIYYVTPWSRAGHRRLYLNDRTGTSLGFTDLGTGAVELAVTDPDERKVAETLLSAVERTGITVAPGQVPKVPTKLFGGRLLSRLASRHAAILVGQEWRAFGKHRLYGTLLDPRVTTSDLGWVDLKAGDRHPTTEAPGPGDRESPDVYLQYLLHHRPRRP